jgi:GNAT superfamily N-acetyltransferase
MNSLNPQFEIPGYNVSLLGTETIANLQGLLERCAEYNLLVSGEPPGSSAAQSLLAECPPGRSSEDKLVIGISTADANLVGVLDAIRGYPQADCCWVGLLLIDPSFRNKGLGRLIYQSFEQWAGQLGAKYILIGVIEENQRACRFWKQMGFELVEKQPQQKFGMKNQVVITMVRNLTG